MATTIPGPAESHDNDSTSAETAAGRNVGLSLLEGHSRKVPALWARSPVCAFLKVDDHCSVCRLDFTGHLGDNLPAYLVIVTVGQVFVPVVLWTAVDYAPSLAFERGIYLPILALASISIPQRVKGAVMGLQWSLKMDGFSVHPPDELQA